MKAEGFTAKFRETVNTVALPEPQIWRLGPFAVAVLSATANGKHVRSIAAGVDSRWLGISLNVVLKRGSSS